MTPHMSAAARVRQARSELAAAESALASSARPWWRRVQSHRGALAGTGGFALGLALTLLPLRWWTKAGAATGAAAAAAARSALLPMIIGAALSQKRQPEASPDPPACVR